MPAILVEPLFASNPDHAAWIRSEAGQDRLAQILADSIRRCFPDGGRLAFSIGHKYKTTSPNDRGAAVHGGGTEADYAEIVLGKAAALLAVADKPAAARPFAVMVDNREVWRYDAETGAVPEPFPIYSVHQHGMAPMTLHLLASLGLVEGETHRRVQRESLAWLWHNQLGRSMVDAERRVVYRSVRRRFPVNRVAYTLGRLGPLQRLTREPGFLRLNATCRPYELGWLAYAWAGREDTLG